MAGVISVTRAVSEAERGSAGSLESHSDIHGRAWSAVRGSSRRGSWPWAESLAVLPRRVERLQHDPRAIDGGGERHIRCRRQIAVARRGGAQGQRA